MPFLFVNTNAFDIGCTQTANRKPHTLQHYYSIVEGATPKPPVLLISPSISSINIGLYYRSTANRERK
jgi:hypothetical protein